MKRLLILCLVPIAFAPPTHADVRADYRVCENGLFEEMEHKRRVPVPGDAAEQYCLGLGYATGFGILPRSAKQASHWYLKAANGGNAGAQAALGYHYEKGIGVQQNLKEAVKWYRKSAAQGYDDGLFHLYRVYSLGRGVNKNPSAAQKWLRQAAERGHPKAKQILAKQARNAPGIPGQDLFARGKKQYDRKNYRAAAVDFSKAGRMGNSRAQAFMGLLYEEGLGVEKNYGNAFKWYLAAAKQGHSAAQKAVGQMYETGRGTRENWPQAVQWYGKSAKQGNKEGLYALARMYQFGMAVPQDRYRAMELFERAADQDHPKGAYFARHLRGGGCIGTRNRYEYLRWSGVCAEPRGIAFRNAAQRQQWLGAQAARAKRLQRKFNWQQRKSEYDECVRENASSANCSPPGPEPD